MKKLIFLLLSLTLFCISTAAQTDSPAPTAPAATPPSAEAAAPAEKPRRQVFRPTKDQITQAQTFLRAQNQYSGEATGKYDKGLRAAIKVYQEANGLSKTGRLDRPTLEKMGIELTDSQKAIPVKTSETKDPAKDGTAKTKSKIFRASRDQVTQAQRILKAGGLYGGEETGRLNADTRSGLKKFQEANGLKVSGTLDRETIVKMDIELTEKQKADAAAGN